MKVLGIISLIRVLKWIDLFSQKKNVGFHATRNIFNSDRKYYDAYIYHFDFSFCELFLLFVMNYNYLFVYENWTEKQYRIDKNFDFIKNSRGVL